MALRRIVLFISLTLGLAACRRTPAPAAVAPLPQTSGTLAVEGLASPVTVVRDRWGIPHIYAASPSDLFFAQGFVQAQDRLFQMDLWRRSVQGRLSEVLGANFVERDAMTRRIQYRGAMESEWASYGDDTRAIAEAFVRGVNAWVNIARTQLPEEFRLAGWSPERWAADDLVNRTDAFLASGNGDLEVFRARLAAAVGARHADALLPPLSGIGAGIPRGVDIAAVSYVVAEALKRVGAAPLFSGFAAQFGERRRPDRRVEVAGLRQPLSATAGSNSWAVGPRRTATGRPLLAVDPHRPLSLPSLRYLVHLKAPGWNVIGAASPWLPGVAIGHNERLAWGITSLAADVQDIYVEETSSDRPHQVRGRDGWVSTEVVPDPIAIKGRPKTFEFEREYSAHGVLIASDRERGRAFTVRWTGFEPGTAAELGALGVDRAESERALLTALRRWKLPTSTVVYADADGQVGSRRAGWVPVRRAWSGELPASGWTGAYEWQGWRTLADEHDPSVERVRSQGIVLSANENPARTARLESLLLGPQRAFDVPDFQTMQHDTLAWNAQQLVPLLGRVSSDRPSVEAARRGLLTWDHKLTAESPTATMYVLWERELRRRLAEAAVPSLRDELASRLGASFVQALTRPSTVWFSRDPIRARDRLLLDALAAVAERFSPDRPPLPWGQLHTALFAHPLGITAASRARFNIGPFEQPGYADSVVSTSGADLEASAGPTLRAIFDVGSWDRSVVVNAPGQSEDWRSPHYSDLAKIWSGGDYVPLVFSDSAVQANQEATLVLTPLPR